MLNEHTGISPKMALKIEHWLGVDKSGRAELWADMQLDYDMWQARQFEAAELNLFSIKNC